MVHLFQRLFERVQSMLQFVLDRNQGLGETLHARLVEILSLVGDTTDFRQFRFDRDILLVLRVHQGINSLRIVGDRHLGDSLLRGIHIGSRGVSAEGRRHPGDRLDIRYVRKGSEKTASVILSDQRSVATTFNRDPENVLAKLGMDVRELTTSEKSRLHTGGVLVQKIDKGGIIDMTNMEEDYIITSVNDKPIKSVEELVSEINKGDKKVMFNGFYERFPGEYPYAFEKR